jgi:lipopolysaccharide biosynthesis protein
VSLPEDRYEAASQSIRRDYPTAVTIPVPNRGRDIGPFLALAKKVDNDGIEIICKVHTKRSAHRSNGEEWRRDLFEKVLGTGSYPQLIISALRDNPAIGLIIPQGHAISVRHFWGANEQRVLDLAEKIGYQRPLSNFAFPAGSMFWMRTDALRPILDLGLSFGDFEEEAGQYDGTLAHAVERLLPIAARIRGYRTVDTRVLGWKAANGQLRSDLELAVMREPLTDYPFVPTQRSKRDEH